VYVTVAVQVPAAQLGVPIVPRLPWVGAVPIVKVNDAFSTSVADNVTTNAVSSAVVGLCGFPTGVSLTAVIVRLTVAGVEFDVPSLVVNVKLSVPL
jgi:hypothetical protein